MLSVKRGASREVRSESEHPYEDIPPIKDPSTPLGMTKA